MKRILLIPLLFTLVGLCGIRLYGEEIKVDGIFYYIYTPLHHASVAGANKTTTGELVIPENIVYGGEKYTVNEVWGNAFHLGYDWLTSVILPSTIECIESYAFEDCSALSKVTIPAAVTKIGKRAFYGCTSLVDVMCLAPTPPNAEQDVFDNTPLRYLRVSLNSISAYQKTSPWNKFKTINSLPIAHFAFEIVDPVSKTLKLIGFDATDSSAEISIPGTIVSDGEEWTIVEIGARAFQNQNSITYVNIPQSIAKIGASAFASCSNLKAIEVAAGNSVYASIDGVVYNKDITQLVSYPCAKSDFTFPSAVNSIYQGAFEGCKLTTINLPTTLKSIEPWTFAASESLSSITIPQGVSEICESAFSDCGALQTVTIPKTMTTIGSEAFARCRSLADFTSLANWPPKTNDNAFGYILACTLHVPFGSRDAYQLVSPWKNFKTIISSPVVDGFTFELVDNKAKTVKVVSWTGTGTNLEIPATVMLYGEQWTVTGIDAQALHGSTTLTSVTIPNTVTAIGRSAFAGCSSLRSITIPEGVTSIGANAFAQCTALTRLLYNAKACNSIDRTTFPATIRTVIVGNTVTMLPTNFLYSVRTFDRIYIPNNVTSVGDDAFENCLIKSLTVGAGLQSITNASFGQCKVIKAFWMGNTAPAGANLLEGQINYVSNDQYKDKFKNQKRYQFLSSHFEADGVIYVPVSPSERTCDVIDCSYDQYLGSISVNRNVTNRGIQFTVHLVNDYSFYNYDFVKSVTLANRGNIGNYALTDCTSLGNAILGLSITGIGDYAFAGCTSLRECTVPDSVATLGKSAFADCNALERIKLGRSLSILDVRVFSHCGALQSLNIPANVLRVNDYAFEACTSLSDVTFADGDPVITLGSNGSSPLFADCPLGEVYIGRELNYDTAAEFGFSPFSRNVSLRSVQITDEESQIYDNEFYGCSGLKTLKIGNGVNTIGRWAFSGCWSLEYFSAGTELRIIGQEAFSDCTGMTKFYSYAEVPPTCGNQALDDINKWNCTLYVPAQSVDAYKAAQQWKDFFYIEKDNGVDDIYAEPGVQVRAEGGIIHIEGATGPYTVYDAQGRCVISGFNTKICGLANGLYIVKVDAMTCKVKL